MRRVAPLAVLPLILAGCGGGGGGSTTNPGGELPAEGTEQTMGPITVRFSGGEPVVAATQLSSAVATRTSAVNLSLVKTASIPSSLTDRTAGARLIALVNGVPLANGIQPASTIVPATASAKPFNADFLSADPKGQMLLTRDTADGIVMYDLMSDVRKPLGIPTGRSPRFSPTGERFAYIQGTGASAQIRIRFRSNSGDRVVPNTSGVTHFDWDTEGRMVYAKQNGTVMEIRFLDIDGTNIVLRTSTTGTCNGVASGGVPGTYAYILNTVDGVALFSASTGAAGGSQIQLNTNGKTPISVDRYVEPGSYMIGNSDNTIGRADARGPVGLLTQLTGTVPIAIVRPSERTFVGSEGWPALASAILYGSGSASLNSMVAFQAKTLSTASIEEVELTEDRDIAVFQLKADEIRALSYAANIGAPTVTLLRNGNTPFGGAFVTMNGFGQVTTIMPLANLARTGAPKVTAQGGRILIEGPVLGLYSEGEDKAPNGATRVEIDAKTGAVLSAS
ncbi:hypothetical protein EON79_01970 [bacterium]|nr:MAG: hypothetical protein EON79_01970 [bacterium]